MIGSAECKFAMLRTSMWSERENKVWYAEIL